MKHCGRAGCFRACWAAMGALSHLLGGSLWAGTRTGTGPWMADANSTGLCAAAVRWCGGHYPNTTPGVQCHAGTPPPQGLEEPLRRFGATLGDAARTGAVEATAQLAAGAARQGLGTAATWASSLTLAMLAAGWRVARMMGAACVRCHPP